MKLISKLHQHVAQQRLSCRCQAIRRQWGFRCQFWRSRSQHGHQICRNGRDAPRRHLCSLSVLMVSKNILDGEAGILGNYHVTLECTIVITIENSIQRTSNGELELLVVVLLDASALHAYIKLLGSASTYESKYSGTFCAHHFGRWKPSGFPSNRSPPRRWTCSHQRRSEWTHQREHVCSCNRKRWSRRKCLNQLVPPTTQLRYLPFLLAS